LSVELEALRLFLAVVENSSFTRAGTKSGMTQSALSRQVQRLERELNARLLYRDGRGVKLTEAGEKLVRAARQIFASIDALKDELIEDSSRFRGTLTLGLPPSFGATISGPLVRRFREEYPEARLRVLVAFSGALTEWLEAGRIDAATLYDVHRSATLLVTPLLRESLYLVSAPSKRSEPDTVSLSELGKGSYVIPCSENGMRKIIDSAAARLNIKMRIAAEIDSLDATKEIVEAGTERCILPLGAVHREVKAGKLIAQRFENPALEALLVLATPLHKPVTRLTSAVLRMVEAEVMRCVKAGILGGVAGSDLQH
jgi:LysR family transcriptional regulator, nitrogen assimilation regulatory protein